MRQRMWSIFLTAVLVFSAPLSAFGENTADGGTQMYADWTEGSAENDPEQDEGQDGSGEESDSGEDFSSNADRSEAEGETGDLPEEGIPGEEDSPEQSGGEETLPGESEIPEISPEDDPEPPEPFPDEENVPYIGEEDPPEQPDDPDLPDEDDFFVFSDGEGPELEGETPEDQELVEEIEDGSIIAFAPIAADAGIDIRQSPVMTVSSVVSQEEGSPAAVAAMNPDQYTFVPGYQLYCDEVWTAQADAYPRSDPRWRCGTIYRIVKYVDYEGVERQAPLYCMIAQSYAGADQEVLREEAVRALRTEKIRKILYYGYEGPGDICDDYDPTCSHIDWSRWQNRFLFTHLALSRTYSSDAGNATEGEIEHVGLNRFMAEIDAKTLPDHKGVELRTNGADGGKVQQKKLTVNLVYYPVRPRTGYDWVDEEYRGSFQATRNIRVVDTEDMGNGITIERPANAAWNLGYWKNTNDYNTRGGDNPRVLPKGESVTLKNDAMFKIVFPRDAGAQSWSCPMRLKPLSYILVDGDAQWDDDKDHQDFGAYVYQGEKGTVSLQFIPQPYGNLVLTKTSTKDDSPVQGAEYQLRAAEDISSGGVKIYSRDNVVAAFTTGANGQITFDRLIPGRYYVAESGAAPGYLLDAQRHDAVISAGANSLAVQDVPDISGSVSIEKTDKDTGKSLPDAEFAIYAWSEAEQRYMDGEKLSYDSEKGRYVSGQLSYTDDNLGKFRIAETKNPPGYTGQWQRDIVIGQAEQQFLYTVRNERLLGEITVVKKIREADITWAHGNPVFPITVEGTDTRGVRRRYEGMIVFRQDGCRADSSGYAAAELTFRNIPAGTYRIYERKVMRYFLKEAYPNTDNVTVTRGLSPVYGPEPKDIAYGTASLDETHRNASITFVNEKSRYDDYSHNCVVENTVPVDFGA